MALALGRLRGRTGGKEKAAAAAAAAAGTRGHGLEGAAESVERARKRGGGNLGFKYFAL